MLKFTMKMGRPQNGKLKTKEGYTVRTCECGGKVSRYSEKAHLESQKHQTYLRLVESMKGSTGRVDEHSHLLECEKKLSEIMTLLNDARGPLMS